MSDRLTFDDEVPAEYVMVFRNNEMIGYLYKSAFGDWRFFARPEANCSSADEHTQLAQKLTELNEHATGGQS